MKYLLVVLLFFSTFPLYGQDNKVSFFKEKKIKIINFIVEKDPDKLPLITVTILNKSKEDIIFNQIVLTLSDFRKHPLSSSSINGLISRQLTPIAGLDLSLPLRPNVYSFSLKSPIQILKKDVATIQVRLSCTYGKKTVIPSQIGYFKFSFLFLTYDSKAVSSQEVELGNP